MKVEKSTPPGELRPHQRAVLAAVGAEDGRRFARIEGDRDLRAKGCDCEYCAAFEAAVIAVVREAAAEQAAAEVRS